MRSTRIGRFAALAAVAALLLSGCAPEPGAPGSGESGAQQRAFPAVYEQRVEWGACDERFSLEAAQVERLEKRGVSTAEFRCAMILAPFDWNDRDDDETIELAVVHVPSAGAGREGVLFGNPGGPGFGGLDHTYDMVLAEGFDEVAQRYDLLGFDPRGIGRSTPIDCKANSTLAVVRIATCAEQAPLARTMGTSQVARDMELLRHLMGDERMHYLGYSYGTILGATYATLFPERVGRLVLDSAIDASWASLIGHFEQNRALAAGVERMLADCGMFGAIETCPFVDISEVQETMRRLDQQPLVASDGAALNGGALYGYLVTALYQRTVGREMALDAVAFALRGEQRAIDFIAAEMGTGGSAVNPSGVIVKCHSFPSDPDVMGLLAHIDEVGLPPIMGGPEINDRTVGDWIQLNCFALAESGDDITDSFSGSPDAPILVIGITGDHTTYYSGAVQLVKQLGNARLLTLDGVSHGASFMGRSTCADRAVSAYLLRGELPAEGAVCTDD